MPTYTLTYFDGRGRAELTRLVFAAAGVAYKDVRLQFDQWPTEKAKTMYGSLPELDVDGKKIAQSNAIARFLAKEFKLAGANNLEGAVVDQIVELSNDLFLEVIKGKFEKDAAKKAEFEKKMAEETLPKFLDFFQKDLKKNGGKFFVGKSLSLADLAVQNVLDGFVKSQPKLLDKYSELKANREMVLKTPNVEKYLKSRKDSEF